MPKFVKLFECDSGDPVYINSDHVKFFSPNGSGGTHLELTNGAVLGCIESPEEILELISIS